MNRSLRSFLVFVALSLAAYGQSSGGGGRGVLPGSACGDATHASGWTGSAWYCQAITGAAAAGAPTSSLQWNSAGAIAGITKWSTNGTTTLTAVDNTAILDLSLITIANLKLPNAGANQVYGNCTGGSAAPTYCSIIAAMIPTLNQSTTGSAATLTTPRNLAGNAFDGSANVPFANKFIVQGTTDTGLSGAQFLGALVTGFTRNTTTTGVLTSGEITGDCTSTAFSLLCTKLNGTLLSGLTTGLLKITNGTGVPSTATAADVDALYTGAGKCYLFKGTSPGSNDGCDSPAGTGFANPMTMLGDIIYGGIGGTATALPGPTGVNGVPQFYINTPSAGAATAPTTSPAGVPTNPQTGTTYTVLATDRASYVSLNNGSAIAVTLPQAGSSGFASNFVFVTCDIGAGTATITPTTSAISYTTGTAYTASAANMPLTTGQCAWVYSDNSNYFAILRGGAGAAGANTALSNLASVAVNLALSPGSDNAISLDDLTHRFINAWFSGVVGWTNGSGTQDTGISRGSANNTNVGNGTAADKSGTLNVATVCQGTCPTNAAGSGGGVIHAEGTAFTGVTATGGTYQDSTQHAEAVVNGATGAMVISRTACVNVTPTTVNTSTTSDQNLQACSFNANLLNVVGRTLKVYLAGVYSNVVTAQPTVTLKVKLCTVSGCGSGTVITPISITSTATNVTAVTNLPVSMTGFAVTQTAGASSAYEAHGSMTIDLSTVLGAAQSVFADGNTATVGTIDSTGALFLQAAVAFSGASASNSFTSRELVVEVLN